MFSYDHLTAFCVTFEQGSYSKAGRTLGKDRTTIREQVKALEDSYAVELFKIEGKAAVATEAATAIYKQAKLLVKHSERLNTRLTKHYLTPLVNLDFYYDATVPNPLLVAIDDFMAEQHPHVRINWLRRDRGEALKAVAEGTNKVALMQNRMVNEELYPFGYINLGTEAFSVYCHPNHPLTAINGVNTGDLQLEKQYITETFYRNMPELFVLSSDVRIISNMDLLLSLLEKDGWAALSNTQAAPLASQGKLVKLELEELRSTVKVGVSFFYPEARAMSPEVATLIALVNQLAGSYFE